MFLPVITMCLLVVTLAGEPTSDPAPMTQEEREVYLDIIRGAKQGEFGGRFPSETIVSVHHVAYLSRYDTLLTFKPAPPVPEGYRDVISIWRKGWRGAFDLSALESDEIKMTDITKGLPSGCFATFSHIGFDDVKQKAVVLTHIACLETETKFGRRLFVFLRKIDGQWDIVDFRLVDD